MTKDTDDLETIKNRYYCDTKEQGSSILDTIDLSGDQCLNAEKSVYDLHEERLAKYADKKIRALENVDFIERNDSTFNPKLTQRIKDCGNYLLFREYEATGQIKLSQANYCKTHKLCPFCAFRRALKNTNKLVATTEEIMRHNPNLRPYMLTLTVKNKPDLLEGYNHLKNSWNTLRDWSKKAKQGHKWALAKEISNVSGGIYGIEVTNIGNDWHPHMHICLLTKFKGIDIVKFKEEWEDITSDSYIASINPILKDKDDSYFKGMAEVTKYSLKFSELSKEHLLEAYHKLKRKRMVGSFGCYYGLNLEPKDLNDEVDFDNDSYNNMLYFFINNEYELQ